jgi:transposase
MDTMTYVGLDVHARSTHGAAIDVVTGELRRARFGASSEEVIAWLSALPQPLRACYEAGPTGFAFYRAAEVAGVPVQVVAPSKTPRAPGDRVKTDRKDAELLARLLLAGQLKFVAVPSVELEAARHLCRAREQVRSDLMRCRHRVSKLLLLHGRVYPETSTWTQRHRQWLARQRFDQLATELAFLDTLAAVDGLVARKSALEARLSLLAREGEWWPTVARLRCFRGIDTLTAFVLALEIGDFHRFSRPSKLAGWLGLTPLLDSLARADAKARSQRPAPATHGGYSSRRAGITSASPGSARPSPTANRGNPRTYSRSPGVRSTASTTSTTACAPAANPATSAQSPSHASSPASSGPPPWPTNPAHSRLLGRAPGQKLPGTRDRTMGSPAGHARS